MRRVTTIDEVRAASRAARAAGRRVGLVPTMGALHAGHLANVRLTRERCDLLVVSIFVNPTQFGPGEDLESYPRDLEGDEAALAALGDDAPDLVFAPSVEQMYPHERVTTVKVERLADVLCGASRPGHFDGVGTVVTKLLNIVEPDVAAFGRKDFQQLTIIRALVRDLDLPVEILATPTVREPDGLALSSRNVYLDDDERRAALALSRALADAVEAARAARADGRPPDPRVLAETARATLAAEPLVRPDYLEVRDPDTLAPPDPATGGEAVDDRDDARARGGGPAGPRLLVAVAAHVGPARLIDNVVVGDLDDEDRLLAATGRAG